MYKEYYDLHKDDEYDKNWIDNEEFVSALIESVVSLDETLFMESLNTLRTHVREEAEEKDKYIIEFLNIITYIYTSLKEDINNLNKVIVSIDKLRCRDFWYYYKEPFCECINKLSIKLNQEINLE